MTAHKIIIISYFIFSLLLLNNAEATNCGALPPVQPHRIKGGEGFPPLPLPVTPLRRTEKKRPPSPPTLVIKVKYGAKVTKKDENGKIVSYWDWTTDFGDIKNLLDQLNSVLGIQYTSRELELKDFSFDPTETPILYFTGHEPFTWTNEERSKLLAYIVNGGTVWGDACCGAKEFSDSFRHEMSVIFADRPLYILDVDHPVYSMYHPITQVNYLNDKKASRDVPKLEGINIGCRTAVVFSRIDLSCGWDNHSHDEGERYSKDDAKQIGVNMLAYALAYYKTGMMLRYEVRYESKKIEGNEDFFIGHVKHNGDWDPNPSALQNLMLETSRATKVKVNFQVKDVNLASSDLFEFPFIYMCGHFNFSLKDEEIANLRKYLENGGFLLSESCCGRLGFDMSFRREVAKIFPDKKLERIPADSEIFKIHHDIGAVEYTPLITKEKPGFTSPYLEGIEIEGKYVLIYSKYGLANGWERIPHPNTRGVEIKDAFHIGVNTIIYSMTH
jgi:hypothetical protein